MSSTKAGDQTRWALARGAFYKTTGMQSQFYKHWCCKQVWAFSGHFEEWERKTKRHTDGWQTPQSHQGDFWMKTPTDTKRMKREREWTQLSLSERLINFLNQWVLTSGHIFPLQLTRPHVLHCAAQQWLHLNLKQKCCVLCKSKSLIVICQHKSGFHQNEAQILTESTVNL